MPDNRIQRWHPVPTSVPEGAMEMRDEGGFVLFSEYLGALTAERQKREEAERELERQKLRRQSLEAGYAELLRHRDAWRSYCYMRPGRERPMDFLGSNMVDAERTPTAVEKLTEANATIERLRRELDSQGRALTEEVEFRCGAEAERDALTREVDRARELFNRPWDIVSVLQKLSEAADILLGEHDYDRHGWESFRHAQDSAREMIAFLAPTPAVDATPSMVTVRHSETGRTSEHTPEKAAELEATGRYNQLLSRRRNQGGHPAADEAAGQAKPKCPACNDTGYRNQGPRAPGIIGSAMVPCGCKPSPVVEQFMKAHAAGQESEREPLIPRGGDSCCDRTFNSVVEHHEAEVSQLKKEHAAQRQSYEALLREAKAKLLRYAPAQAEKTIDAISDRLAETEGK